MFWDSSALVCSLLPESRSGELTALLSDDREPVIWWGSPVECQSAIHRRHREASISPELLNEALRRLRALVEDSDNVPPTERLRQRAGRLLAIHPLRGADALQLAAALDWCEDQPAGETLVCLDERLREAARREGFALLPR